MLTHTIAPSWPSIRRAAIVPPTPVARKATAVVLPTPVSYAREGNPQNYPQHYAPNYPESIGATRMVSIDLSGKLAVVTGASGELGRVIARTLAEAGADVAVHYRGAEEKADATADAIRALGRRTMTVQADITDEDSVFAMRDAIGAELGSPDIIVNNAVIQYNWVSVLDQAVEDYDGQYKSCVVQGVLMAKAFVPAMVEQKWGRVIATNTECAMQTFAGQSAYVAGKRGMDGVYRVLAKEVGEHEITVNQVAPGFMISDRARAAGTERVESYEKNVPMKRRGEDKDIANAVLFLASDLANFITGVYLPVCGGNVMPRI